MLCHSTGHEVRGESPGERLQLPSPDRRSLTKGPFLAGDETAEGTRGPAVPSGDPQCDDMMGHQAATYLMSTVSGSFAFRCGIFSGQLPAQGSSRVCV